MQPPSELFHPPPRGNRFSIEQPGIVALTTLQPTSPCRLRSTLTPMPSVSVSCLISPLLPCPYHRCQAGAAGDPAAPEDPTYTPTHSSRDSPTSSKAEARRAGSSVFAFTVQSIQPFILSLLSVGHASPLPFNSCCFMPDL